MTGTNASRVALVAAVATFLAAAGTSVAQPVPQAAAPAPWKAKNLKVFPADIPREQLIAAMKTFSTALGVECSFCHANGANGKLDPASDARKEKLTARWMMAMTADLNTRFQVKDPRAPKVSCFTCHRGAAHPPIAPGAKPAEHKH